MTEIYHNVLQEKYNTCFGDKVIPFKKTGKTLEAIIERANKKDPPFSSNKDASDKGFKDCLLWLSLLEYFKNNAYLIKNGYIPRIDYLKIVDVLIGGK